MHTAHIFRPITIDIELDIEEISTSILDKHLAINALHDPRPREEYD